MSTWIRRLMLVVTAGVALSLLPGCGEKEHRKVRVEQEQHEGEVEEERPGEMIVE